MDKILKATLSILIIIGLMILGITIVNTGCGNKINLGSTPSPETTATLSPAPTEEPTPSPTPSKEPDTVSLIRTDYNNYNPNESGEIPVLMFHKFVKAFEPGMDKAYTTTFDEFEKLLPVLYDKGFRLISMKDFIDCNINVPAGTMPMVFSFDDGTPSQFNLMDENGKYKVNPESAVGIMMAFNEKHPDFGLKGIFYLNMDIGDNTFKGAGTLKDRFEFLRNNGFELGSHTWGHVNLKDVKSEEGIIETLGKNQEAALSVLPDLQFYSLALPYGGLPESDTLKALLEACDYGTIHYQNLSIMAVGANPSPPSISPKYNPAYVPRIRMQGQEAVDQDLTWWLPKMTSARMFVSDGDPHTIVIPAANKDKVDEVRLNGKELVIY